jgi:hypothetical protein
MASPSVVEHKVVYGAVLRHIKVKPLRLRLLATLK